MAIGVTIFLAICTVSCVSWILTREQIFEPVRKWAKMQGTWATPFNCVYCVIPWTTLAAWPVFRFELVWLIPIIWASYHAVSVFAVLRKKVSG
jgi:hypothetical protein